MVNDYDGAKFDISLQQLSSGWAAPISAEQERETIRGRESGWIGF